MKPIGTITMDFKFVSRDSREILGGFMEQSKTYAEYVQLLADYVIASQDVADELILLARRHSDNLGRSEAQRRIVEIHQARNAILPYYIMLHAAEKDDWDIVLGELENAIDDSPSDWITYWYLITLYWVAVTRSVDAVRAEKGEERIEDMLRENTSIHCFSPQYYYLKANRQRYERGMKEPLEMMKIGLERAREFDDRYFEARCLKGVGALTGFYDLSPGSADRGKSLLLGAKEICEELGDPRGLIEVLSYLGGISGTNGAFTDGLNANLEMLRVRELIGDKPVYEFHNISAAHCFLQNGKEALEWAKLALEGAASRPLLMPLVNLDMAAALILNGRLQEAQEHIDTARRLNLKAGIESNLAYEYKTAGLLERARGDHDTAIYSLETALEIEERNSRVNRMIATLMYLAETEVAGFLANQKNRDADVSGPWLQRYEATAIENHLQGHIGIARLLKSELRLRQGRHEEARELADAVVSLAEKPGLGYLRDRCSRLLEVFVTDTVHRRTSASE